MIGRITRCMRRRDDEGFAMVMVIGMAFIFAIVVSLLLTMGQNSLSASGRHVNFNTALDTAENGIDQTLSRLQRAYVYYGVDLPVPSTGVTGIDPNPACNAATVTAPSFANANAERDWAKQQIAAMVAAHPNCLQHGAQGDFAVLKPAAQTVNGQPQAFQTIYAQGWSPSYGNSGARTRLIKSNYLFAPYKPSDAVLTGCDLELDSSTTVTTAAGSDPKLAAVHSNCTISTVGNPEVDGPVSSSGDSGGAHSDRFYDNVSTGKKVALTPEESIPVISAREVYGQQWSQYSNNWYDMCPDGTVRPPSASGPCTSSTVLANEAASGAIPWRGFTYTAPVSGGAATWNLVNGAGDGVYYFQAGNVQMGTGLGNPSSNAVTIIAAAANDSACPKVGGSISWDHDDFAAPYMTNLFMLADADLSTGSNFHAGGVNSDGTVSAGLFVAGDQINMETSSQGAYGAVVAGDQCAPSPGEKNVIKNPTIYYDPNAEAPFTDVIDTTLWLEYPG